MRLEQLALLAQELDPFFQLGLDQLERLGQLILGRNEMFGRKDLDFVQPSYHLASQRIYLGDAVHLIAEELDAIGQIGIGRLDFKSVPAQTKLAAAQLQVVAFVEDVHQAAQDQLAAHRLPAAELDRHLAVFGRVAQAVDARHRRHDQHIAPAEKRRSRRQAQPINLIIDVGVLFDVGVGARQVRLRLIVVVIAHEVFDGVVWKELLELGIQLRGQRLVVRHDQRRPVDGLDHRGHDVSLAGAGCAKQRLVLIAGAQPFDQLADGLRLVAGRLEIGNELEVGHGPPCEQRFGPFDYIALRR